MHCNNKFRLLSSTKITGRRSCSANDAVYVPELDKFTYTAPFLTLNIQSSSLQPPDHCCLQPFLLIRTAVAAKSRRDWTSIAMSSASSQLLRLGQRFLASAAVSAGATQHTLAAATTSTAAALRWHAVHASPPPPLQQPPPTPSSSSQPQQQQGAASRQPPRHVIYKGRWIKIVRYAVRCKVAQLMGAGGVAVALAGLGTADLSLADAAVLVGVVVGSVGGSLSLW